MKNKLPINQFSLDELVDNPSIAIIGKRGSGKSFLIRDILNKFSDIPTTVICPTERHNPFYCDIKNVTKIHNNYEPKIIEEILSDQASKPKTTKTPTNPPTDEMKNQLAAITNIAQSSLTTGKLDFHEITTMKQLVDNLLEQKQKQEILNKLQLSYEFIGSLLDKKDIELDDLNTLQNDISNLIHLKTTKQIEPINPQPIDNPKHVLILDDCLSAKGSWFKDSCLTELLFNGRHYNIPYILTMQYPLGISPELRSNFDYIFLFAEDFVSILKRIYDHYAGMFPDFNTFRQIFGQLTEDYGCMVIKNRGSRRTFLDKIAWYKAGEPTISIPVISIDLEPKDRLLHEYNMVDVDSDNDNDDEILCESV